MTPLKIRIELLKKNIGYADIARNCGVSRQLVRYAIVSQAVYNDTKIIQIKKEIAQTLNRPVEKLWPSYTTRRRNDFGGQEVSADRPKQNCKKPQNHVGFGAAPDHVGSRASPEPARFRTRKAA